MRTNIDYFKIESNHVAPAKGKMLIAEPFLGELYFKRSLVFIVEHNDEGSIGFVLNKPVTISLKEVLDEGFPTLDANISLGGPVETNTLHFIHTLGDKIRDSKYIYGNIYWGGNFEDLKHLANIGQLNKENVKFFLGYSGWAAGQLEEEISQNSWLVASLPGTDILKTYSSDSWESALLSMGPRYKMWINAPVSPNLN
jgi:putative transcriptional regulator